MAVLAAAAVYVIPRAVTRHEPRDPLPRYQGGGAVPAPAYGAYFGAWTSSKTGHTLKQREAQIGRKYKIVHLYEDWDHAFPTRKEKAWARGGRTLFFDWSSRNFKTGKLIPWSRIADGREDRTIDAEARRIRDFGAPVLFSFSEEPDLQLGQARALADFAPAYKRIRKRFIAAGATNVAWVWDVSGYKDFYRMYQHGLYPGDQAVDWIAWDPYNWYLCRWSPWTSFSEKVSRFYDWLIAHGFGNKPFMLGEYGSAESRRHPSAKGRWFNDALASLKSGEFPNLKAIVYFDSRPRECDWRIDSSRSSLAGFRRLARDPYMNP